MAEEEEGYDDKERLRKGNSNYFLTLLDLVLFPEIRASFIFSTLHICEKIRIPTVCMG